MISTGGRRAPVFISVEIGARTGSIFFFPEARNVRSLVIGSIFIAQTCVWRIADFCGKISNSPHTGSNLAAANTKKNCGHYRVVPQSSSNARLGRPRRDPRNLYFLGKWASSARRVGIGVARTCSNESVSVSVLPHRTNLISTTSNPSPFNSARFSGPMSSHIWSVFKLDPPPDLAGAAQIFVHQPIRDCLAVRLSDSTKFHGFRYRGQRSAEMKRILATPTCSSLWAAI